MSSACTRRITSGASAWRPLPRRSIDRHPPQAVDLRRRGPDILTGSNQRRTIVLRSPGRLKIWSIDSLARQNEVSVKSSDEDGDASENISSSSSSAAASSERPCAAEDIKLRAKSVEEKAVVSGGGDKRMEVLVAAAATVVLGVGNRVLYKLALVPLKQYPFFLAQLATFGYVVVYFSILYIRRQAGIVTDEMLSLPKAPFLAVGLLEALGAASGMAAGTMLSGASIPILSQTFLIWQLILSAIFLGRRYSVNQLFGCFMVAVGVIITVASGSSSGLSLMKAGIFWSLLMIASFLLQAADTVLKEVIFLDAAKRLKGRSVDLFVVNSFGSAFQALFICLLLPFLSRMWGIPFTQLQSYLKDGAACFLNINTLSTGCDGAPLLPLLFVIVNMGFNISLLHLLKVSSAVVSCLASTFSVPLSVYIFTLPLPYLGSGTALPPGFVAGVAVLVTGMLIYAWRPTVEPAKVQRGLLHEDMCETPLAIVATKATQLSRQSIGKESKQV